MLASASHACGTRGTCPLPALHRQAAHSARPALTPGVVRIARHSSSLQALQRQNSSRQHRSRQAGAPVRVHASAASAAGMTPEGEQQPVSSKVLAFADAFWKFLRPHTIRGTILGASAVTSRALLENQGMIDWGLLPRALLGVLALLCGNGYIVGINQIYDVDIDAVNKPFLPVAAGELSPQAATLLCVALAGGGMALTYLNFDRLITGLYAFGLLLGTLYSVPPLRLKRFAVPAFMIIATVRGFLLNFGVYYATRAALQLPFQWSPAISFITCFVTLFAVVIAITKDLPDVEGDRQYGIQTLATRLGVRKIAFLGSGLLLLNYVGAIVLALRVVPGAFRTWLMVGAHAALGVGLVAATAKLDREGYTQPAIASYYAFIWNLFYSEYALFPFL